MKMRRDVKRIAVAAAAAAAAAAIERGVFASPPYRGPQSGHFDGTRFHNDVDGRQSELAFLKWRMARTPGYWRTRAMPYGPPPPARVDGGALRMTFVNHSTVLLQVDGMSILTDPIWSERPSPFPFVGPKRHRPPGIRFDDLPKIDLVLVSHNHYDHLDVATLRALQRRDRPRIVTPLGNAKLMARHGLAGAIDLDWWQAVPLGRLVVTCVPARHFSARALSDRNKNLWSGFVIGAPSGDIYFAGDTGWGPHFERIAERFPSIRLALLPIGSYAPRWFMEPVHIDPAQAVDAHLILGARTSAAVHFGTFALGDDGEDDPLIELRQAIVAKGEPRFMALDHGEGRDIE